MTESKVEVLHQSDNEPDGFIIKLLRNKSLLINIALAIVLLGLAIGLVQTKLSKRQEKNASMAYASLNHNDQLQPHADIQKLSKIANKYSFLRPYLDAPLVQECINQGELKIAKSFHKRVASRLMPHLDFLFKFNQISFLVTENDYKEALELSYSLKDEINPETLPTLYSYHLLRIAALEKKLGHSELYSDSINEFVSFEPHKEFKEETLKLGDLSLADFMVSQK